MMALQPPTREEVARTIFVGGLGQGTPDDEAIESILRCAGKLRRWTRARDADDEKCKFGFAEYEDVDSLEAANEIFTDVEMPLFKNGAVVKDDQGEVKKAKLLVVVDDQSRKYIDEWKGKRREDDDARQFRLDGCKEDLRQSLTSLANIGAFAANGTVGNSTSADGNGDVHMADGTNGDAKAEIVTIPLGLEDELSDIPAEMRATVAEEIKAFRDRSIRRDLERLRREEELEQAERQRSMTSSRPSRLASPPPTSAPSGPASAANGIPVGPRGGQVQGAPAGPKGYRGAQMPNDYVNGVSFVGANGMSNGFSREDEDAEESDEELERRRQAKRDAEQDKAYADASRRWQNRERTRSAAIERERQREEIERKEREREMDMIAKRLRDWNDDDEAKVAREEYYLDRSSWLRKRGAYRDREQRDDDRDRAAEEREKNDEKRKTAEARGMADEFLNQTGSELERKAAATAEQPALGGFKISLGSAAARTKAAAAATAPAPRRAMADVEGLLEDEEDAAASGLKRPELKPLTDTSTAPTLRGQDLSDEERTTLRRQLAAEIPLVNAALFSYPIQWQLLTPAVVTAQIRPFVEKKVVEYLGVQEDLLVETVMEGLHERKGAEAIQAELAEALEDEAEELVHKVWRLVVFWTESEGRGLN